MPERSQPLHPSGEQIMLAYGDQCAWVVEVGGALRAYSVGERALLDGYGADEMCSGARGQTLAPWPNRLRDGSYEFAGRRHQLPLTEPDRRNAIHGLVRWANWRVADRDGDRVTMEHVLHPQPGYPFALRLSIAYRLADDGLTVETAATNVGDTACPYGAGAHPYLTVGSATVDAVVLRSPAAAWLPSDERAIPTGIEPVEGTKYDFRRPRPIGATKIDTGFADLERDPDGRARVELVAPGTGATATLWLDESYPYLMLFTGDSLPDAARRRRGLGIEPMSCAPNAFQSGDGLRVLAPGESFTAAWGIDGGPVRSR